MVKGCIYSLCFFMLLSCKEAKKIQKESEEWRNVALQLSKEMQEMADDVSKAIPGERYQRLIEEANSSDPIVRANAKAYIKRLFNIDIDSEYVINITIDTKDSLPIHMTTFQASTLFRDEILKKVKTNSIEYTKIRQVSKGAPTLEILKRDLSKSLEASFNSIVGVPTYRKYAAGKNSHGFTNYHEFIDNELKRPSLGTRQRNWVPNLNNERKVAINDLAESLLQPFKPYYLPLDSITYTNNWKVSEAYPYIFLLIKEKDFNRIKNTDFIIQASVHEKGNQSNILFRPTPIEIKASDFNVNRNPPVPMYYKDDRLVWFVTDMTGYAEMYPSKLKQLNETIAKIDSMQLVMESQ